MDLLTSDMTTALQLERRNSDGDLGKRTMSNASQCSRGRRNGNRQMSMNDDNSIKSPDSVTSHNMNGNAVQSNGLSIDSSDVPLKITGNGSVHKETANDNIKVNAIIFETLKNDLERAQSELRQRDDECRKLSRVRDNLDNEVEDLTASLFEEAHKLVREANIKRHNAEMKHNEISMRVEGLQAEVGALKMLVITSTPANPGKKGHRRMASVDQICKDCGTCHASDPETIANGCWTTIEAVNQKEVDPIVFKEFLSWLESRCPFSNHLFIDKVWDIDIKPCLCFSNDELGNAVLAGITNNTLIIEPVKGKLKPKKCALARLMLNCSYRLKTHDGAEWHYISQGCQAKIAAVGSLCTYLRYIQQGLVKKEVTVMYWDMMKKRGDVSLARLGLQKHR